MANPNPRTDQIEPYQFSSGKEAAKAGTKGGKASVESRRKKKRMRELLELVGDTKIKNPKMLKMAKDMMGDDVSEEDLTYALAATLGVYTSAMKGNVAAYEKIFNERESEPLSDVVTSGTLSDSMDELAAEMEAERDKQ